MATKRAPWKRDNPRKRAKRLFPQEKKAAAKALARPGRAYPNLADNMRVAAKKKAAKKTSTRKRVGRKRAARASSS